MANNLGISLNTSSNLNNIDTILQDLYNKLSSDDFESINGQLYKYDKNQSLRYHDYIYDDTQLQKLQQELYKVISEEHNNLSDILDNISYLLSDNVYNIQNITNLIQTDLVNLKEEIIQDNIKPLQTQINQINSTVNSDINSLSSDMVDLGADIQNAQSDIQNVQSDLNDLGLIVDGYDDDISAVQSSLNDVQSDINDNQSDINDLKSNMLSAQSDIQNNANNISVVSNSISDGDITSVEYDTTGINLLNNNGDTIVSLTGLLYGNGNGDITTATLNDIKNTALGKGSETAMEAMMKCQIVGNTKLLCKVLNNYLISTLPADRGLIQIKYSTTGAHLLLFNMGLNETNYPSNAARGCTQVLMGACIEQAPGENYTIDSDSLDWTEAPYNIPNGINISYNQFNILIRKLSYDTNGNRVVTPWTDMYSYFMEQNYKSNQNMRMGRGINFYGNLFDFNHGQLAHNGPVLSRVFNANKTTAVSGKEGSEHYWSMNGLTDLTDNEMTMIWMLTANKLPQPDIFSNYPIRTNYGFKIRNIYDQASYNSLFSLQFAFYNCTKLEVAQLTTNGSYGARAHNYNYMFGGCRKLTTILGYIDMSYMKEPDPLFNKIFYNCQLLEDVNIMKLSVSGLSFEYSPNLSADSISYLITNSTNTSPISVIVHPTTLTNINSNIDAWEGILSSAVSKNISFVTA